MRKSLKADKLYHHNYYMKHRTKYRLKELRWGRAHPAEHRKRARMTYRHKQKIKLSKELN